MAHNYSVCPQWREIKAEQGELAGQFGYIGKKITNIGKKKSA